MSIPSRTENTPMMAGHPPTQRLRNLEEAEAVEFLTTPLHIAALQGDHRAVESFLAAGRFVDAPDQDMQTPLLMACEYGQLQCVQILLAAGADVDGASTSGRTPLMASIESGKLAAVELLLARGVEVDAADVDGRTALHCAAVTGNAGLVRLLVSAGASVDVQDSFGVAPLHQATRGGHMGVVSVLLDFKADPLIGAWDGRTALHEAAEHPRLSVLPRLVADTSPATLDGLKDTQGNNPLHLAASSGSMEAVEMLLERKLSVDTQGMLQWTPLHFAVRCKHLALTQLLLRHGADVNAVAMDGMSALQYAESNSKRVGMQPILELMRSHSVEQPATPMLS